MEDARVSLWTDQSSDAELIAGVRAGESAAFGVLFERHGAAARRVASMYSGVPSDVDDIVSEAFARVLKALQQGDGPDMAFRAYLFTVVRRTGLDVISKGKRTRLDEDMTTHDKALGYEKPSDEPALDNFEQSVVADAFKSLPERWQVVLWYTEIEKKSPAEVAPLLGLSPNGVAALAYRAREALRQAYLQQHLATADNLDCLAVSEHLAAYVRGGLTKREHTKVEAHVKSCDRCAALIGELEDVNRGLRSVIAPLILGLIGVGALETSLPIGGVGAGQVGAGAAGGIGGAGGAGGVASGVAAGAGAGTAVGVGGFFARIASMGHAGSAPTSVTSGFLAGTFGSGSGLLTGFAATVGVTALAVASAGIVGSLGYHPTPFASDNPTGTVQLLIGAAPSAKTSDLPVYIPDANGGSGDTTTPVHGSSSASSSPVDVTGTGTGSGTGTGGDTGTGSGTGTGGDTGTGSGTGTGGDTGTGTGTGGDTGSGSGTDTPDVNLSLNAGAVGYIELSATSPAITTRVANTGTDDSGPVTVTVTPPSGVTFTGPSGGGVGMATPSAEGLAAWLGFAADGTMAVGDWLCDVAPTTATCTISSVHAGTVETLNLGVAVSGTLPGGAVTHFTVADNAGYSDSLTVPTGMAPTGRQGELLYADEGNLGTAIAGGFALTCNATESGCEKAQDYNGNALKDSNNNNAWDMQESNTQGGKRNSAATTLTIPTDATIKKAYLLWSANHGPSDGFTDVTNVARVRPPGASDYVEITADSTSTWTDPGGRVYYQARADVTNLVNQYGGGSWAIADIAVADGRTDTDPSYFAGFSLTAVYDLATLPKSKVAVYGGPDPITKEDDAEYTFAADGENDVKVSTVAWEGDRGLGGDTLTLDGEKMTPEHTTSGGAISTGDKDNAFDSTAFGSGVANTLGTDAKDFKTETVGDGEHTLTASTDGDNLAVGMVVIQTTPTDDSSAASSDDGSSDGGSTDGGSTDGGSTDGGSTDGGSTDGGSSDTGSTDGGSSDTGSDSTGS